MLKTNPIVVVIIALLLVSCKQEPKQDVVITQELQQLTAQSPKTFKVKNIGDTLDVFNEVYVIYNKSMGNTSGRHLTKDGYNLGLKWQCVEFVKRYYYEHLNHKMPNSYGHAVDFFNTEIADGSINRDRNLLQYTNGSSSKPKVNDLVVFKGNMFNPYGHVAIVSRVEDSYIEIVQQNVGKQSRDQLGLKQVNRKWIIDETSILGWLRKD